jgi:hypothetical protein
MPLIKIKKSPACSASHITLAPHLAPQPVCVLRVANDAAAGGGHAVWLQRPVTTLLTLQQQQQQLQQAQHHLLVCSA